MLWNMRVYQLWTVFFPEDIMEAIEVLGTKREDIQKFDFDPDAEEFAPFRDQFRELLQNRPDESQLLQARIDFPEKFGLPSTPVTPGKNWESLISPEQKALVDERKPICDACPNKVRLNTLSVQCALCGCPGVSFISGRCRDNPSRWPVT